MGKLMGKLSTRVESQDTGMGKLSARISSKDTCMAELAMALASKDTSWGKHPERSGQVPWPTRKVP